jgi:hypothetical protein
MEKAKACRKCQLSRLGGREVYSLEGYSWDVSLARRLVADGRSSYMVPDGVLVRLLAVNCTYPEHLTHVDLGAPGVIARFAGHLLLLDGSHRARRSREEGKAFKAYILSVEESDRCLTASLWWRAPPGLR